MACWWADAAALSLRREGAAQQRRAAVDCGGQPRGLEWAFLLLRRRVEPFLRLAASHPALDTTEGPAERERVARLAGVAVRRGSCEGLRGGGGQRDDERHRAVTVSPFDPANSARSVGSRALSGASWVSSAGRLR